MSIYGGRFGMIVASLLLAAQASAQDDMNAVAQESIAELDEIVVYGSRSERSAFTYPGNQEFWRQQILDQIALMRVEEEERWREALTSELSKNPRILVGFDPSFDLERRMYLDITDQPGDAIKTATLIRTKF